MRKYSMLWRGIPILLCFLLLGGCARLKAPNDQPTGSVDEWIDALEPEVRAAVEAKKPALFWKIDESTELKGTAQIWSYKQMNCHTLWTDIQASLFPNAETVSVTELGLQSQYQLRRKDSSLEVIVEPEKISIQGLPKAEADRCAGQLADILAEKTGFELRECAYELLLTPDALTDYLKQTVGITNAGEPLEPLPVWEAFYASYLDGTPVDPWFLTCCVYVRDGCLILHDPIQKGELRDTVTLDGILELSQLRAGAELSVSADLQNVYLLYSSGRRLMKDYNTQTLIPAWSFYGPSLPFDGGAVGVSELLIDAQTGTVRRFY